MLHVSNQSFDIDPVDIRIKIDGKAVISQDFRVLNQHNWKQFTLRVAPGQHVLTAESTRGGAVLVQSFRVTGKHWAVVDYTYNTKAHGEPTPKRFYFLFRGKPIGFA